MANLFAAAREFSLWVTPVLLFSVPVAILTDASGGVWIGLLVVVAPLLGFLLASGRSAESPAHPIVIAALGLMGSVLLWANLLVVGDVTRGSGFSRPIGVLVAAAVVFVITAWNPVWRWGPALALVALLALLLPLGIVVGRAGRQPLAAWSHVASLRAFRFSPESPWVTEGRAVVPRRGTDTLLFEEEHRITPLAAGPLRILVGDGGRVRVQEWTLAANQSVTVRPGDRLVLEPGRSLRFEANKRIPGAPASGVDWANPPHPSPGMGLLSMLGSGLTLLGGAAALLTFGHPAPTSRAAVAMAGAGYLLALAWAEGWATYTASLAPELFLGGVAPEKLPEFPALALRVSSWGPLLSRLVLLGGFLSLLASASALRALLARAGRGGGDVRLWGAMVGGAGLGSFWLLDPWSVLLIAFGVGASTLAPLAWVGVPPERPGTVSVAVGTGGCLFLALAVSGQILTVSEVWVQIILNYPALVASPVATLLLWLARRDAG